MARATHLKEGVLKRWAALPDRQDPLPLMEVIPYKATGSTYGACGIRIDGTPEFVDAVLSNLKSLISGENNFTRLGLSRNAVATKLEVNGKVKTFTNSAAGAEVCYIRLHERGGEGQHASLIFDRHLHEASAKWGEGRGLLTADETALLRKRAVTP